MRFLLEMIEGIRRECGADFPIVVRLAVDEYYRCIGETDRGIELEEGVEIARRLEKASIDEHYIDITGMDRFFGSLKWTHELRRTIIQNTGLPISFSLARR